MGKKKSVVRRQQKKPVKLKELRHALALRATAVAAAAVAEGKEIIKKEDGHDDVARSILRAKPTTIEEYDNQASSSFSPLSTQFNTEPHHRALDVSEILGKILGYVLNEYEYSTRLSHCTVPIPIQRPPTALLVCRWWHKVGRHVLVKMFAVDMTTPTSLNMTRSRDHLLARQSLQVTYKDYKCKDNSGNDGQEGSSTQCRMGQLVRTLQERRRPIKEFRLIGLSDSGSQKEVMGLFSEPIVMSSWLTYLDLRFGYKMHQVDLAKLLTKSSDYSIHRQNTYDDQQESFYDNDGGDHNSSGGMKVSQQTMCVLRLPSLRHLQLYNVVINDLPDGWSLPTSTGYSTAPTRGDEASPMQLRTLHLVRVAIRSQSLELLLKQLCGPNLERLQVTDLRPFPIIDSMTDWYLDVENPPVSAKSLCKELLEQLRVQCSSALQSIHIPQETEGGSIFPVDSLAADKLLEVHNMFPAASWKAISFCNPYGALWWMSLDRHLTTLEIQAPNDRPYSSHSPPTVLHRFLCSDQAQPLQRLIAPALKYSVDFMDPVTIRAVAVERPCWYWSHIHRARKVPPSWRCRDLRVLELGFSTDPIQHGYARSPSRTRCVLGYIVAHCPKLEELYMQRQEMDTTANNGLCFLSRLPYLRKVVIRTSQFLFPIEGAAAGFMYTHPHLNKLHRGGNKGDGSSNGGGGGSSRGSATGPGAASSVGNMGSSLKDVRWVVGKPSLVDLERGWTSLAYCRKVAEQDMDLCFFGPGQAGEGMLWPVDALVEGDVVQGTTRCGNSSASSSSTAVKEGREEKKMKDKEKGAAPTHHRVAGDPLRERDSDLVVGCCWQQMESFTIHITDSCFSRKHICQINVRQMARLRPDVKFESVSYAPSYRNN